MNDYIPWKIRQQFGDNYLSVKELSSGLEVNYNCPYCVTRGKTPDTKGHLFVNIESGVYHCYRCEAAGRVYSDGTDQSNDRVVIDNTKLLNRLKECNDKLQGTSSVDEVTWLKIPYVSVLTNPIATEYMTNRGFSESLLVERDVRVGSIFDELYGRVVVPNRVKDLVYTDMYSARSYLNQDRKYLNPTVKKSNIVYNLHRISDNPEYIIITEGVLTAMRAGSNAVAVYGHSCSKSQLRQIYNKNPKLIYVNYDRDAYLESLELCKEIYDRGIPVINVVMPDNRDAADYELSDYMQIVKSSRLYKPNYDELVKVRDLIT